MGLTSWIYLRENQVVTFEAVEKFKKLKKSRAELRSDARKKQSKNGENNESN